MRNLSFIISLVISLSSFSQADSIIRANFLKQNPDNLDIIEKAFNASYKTKKLSISFSVVFDRNLFSGYYATQYKLEYITSDDTTFESGTSDYYYINLFRNEHQLIYSSYIDANKKQISLLSDSKSIGLMINDYKTIFKTKLDTSITFKVTKKFDAFEFPNNLFTKIKNTHNLSEINKRLCSQFPEDRMDGIRLLDKLKQIKSVKINSNTALFYNMAISTKGKLFICFIDVCEWEEFQDLLKEIHKK